MYVVGFKFVSEFCGILTYGRAEVGTVTVVISTAP